jgi:uncharacterized protein YggE
VSVDYVEGNHPSRGIEGYRCRRSYCATLKDLKLIDKLVDAVLKNGANQFSGIEFRTSELRKHRDQARRMAIKAAKEKAALAQQQKAEAEAAKARREAAKATPRAAPAPRTTAARKSTRQTPTEAATSTFMRTATRELTKFVFRGMFGNRKR